MTRPLKAMIAVAQLTSGQSSKFNIVLNVGGRDNHRLWASELEEDPTKSSQAWSIEMLDDLNDSRGIIASQTLISIGQSSLHQMNTLFLARGQTIEMQTALGKFQSAIGDIHTQNAFKLFTLQQKFQQTTLTTAQIKHAAGSTAL